MAGDKSPVYPSYYYFSSQALAGLDAAYYYKTATPEEAADSKWYGWNYYETTTNRWKLTDFGPKYEPDPPDFKNVKVKREKFLVEWLPARDSDNDLLGYRVYVSSRSRGWNYQDIDAPESVKSTSWVAGSRKCTTVCTKRRPRMSRSWKLNQPI
ncbi:hypothetical protein WJ977_09135 [Achromobacter xylosoxidans]